MQLIPLDDHNAQVSSFTFAGVVAVWNSMPESKEWGPVDWVYGVRGKPSLAMLGALEKNGGEVYAVLDVFDRRTLPTEEFPGVEVELEQIPGGPELPATAKRKALAVPTDATE